MNKVDNNDRTPLNNASQAGQIESVKYLISQGGDVNQSDNCGWSPLHVAAFKGHVSVIDILISHGADMNTKVTSSDWSEGMTPLIMAIHESKVSAAEALIKHGADVNIGNKEGKRPLTLAKEKGMNRIVELIKEHGGHK